MPVTAFRENPDFLDIQRTSKMKPVLEGSGRDQHENNTEHWSFQILTLKLCLTTLPMRKENILKSKGKVEKPLVFCPMRPFMNLKTKTFSGESRGGLFPGYLP